MGFGGDDAAQQARLQQQQQEAKINAAVGNIDRTFSKFDDKFFGNRAQAYTAFAMPQLGQQFRDTKKQVDFNLADRGLVKSGAGTSLMSSLLANLNTQKQGVIDAGVSQANDLRQQVAQNKSNLIGQAETAQNPATVARQAIATASSLSAPSAFAPIGNLLGNWANVYLANRTNQATQPLTNYYLRGGGAPLPSSPITTGGY